MRKTLVSVSSLSTQFLPSILLLGLLLSPAQAAAQVQTKDQQKCILELNKGLAKLAKERGKHLCKCIKAGSKGKLVGAGPGIEACLRDTATFSKDKVARAEAKFLEKTAAKCADLSDPNNPTQPDFGISDPNTVLLVAADKELSLIRRIFGQLAKEYGPCGVGNRNGDPSSVPAEPIALNQLVRNTPFIEIDADSLRQGLMIAERVFRTRCGCGHALSVAPAGMTQTEGTIITR